MVVAGRVGAVESPSQTWQERPAIRQGEGVFLAGDMVAAPGVLSEIASPAARRPEPWLPHGPRRRNGDGQ